MPFKNKFIACLIVSSMIGTNVHATGIPVFDAAGAAQAIATVIELQNQIKQMERQFAAISGSRHLGQILNDPALNNYLPEEWNGIYDKVNKGQLNGISNSASDIAKMEGYNPNATGGQLRYQNVMAANKAMTQQAFQKTLARLNNIQGLMQQANAMQDAKASADLQNRIASENAMIQNEQTRLNLMAQLQQVEVRMAEDQRSKEYINNFAK